MSNKNKNLDHPIIVQTCYSTDGKLGFEGSSPYLVKGLRDLFLSSIRNDISLLKIERAKPIFRKLSVIDDGDEIQPEICSPYRDANSTGFYLKNVLPLVFVKTRKGEVLPDSRVALKYLRENAKEFQSVLKDIKKYSLRIFQPSKYNEFKMKYPLLFSDVIQPYTSFSNKYMNMKSGCYIISPRGTATLLGPPINQKPILHIYSGLIETQWYNSEIFCVFDQPEFNSRVLFIKPDTILAQFYFITKGYHERTKIKFSATDFGATTYYRKRSINVGLEQLKKNSNIVYSKLTGTKSISVSCPHCYVSITKAAEEGVPKDHIIIHDFYQGYKLLKSEFNKGFS